jgi:nucleotide sugar dehydrogenase
MKVAVVGLGKVGLPLAVQYATRGLSVAGYDIDQARVDAINECCPLLPGEEGFPEALFGVVRSGRLRATSSAREAVSAADVVVLIVPVGLGPGDEPDFSNLDDALQVIEPFVRNGALVAVESTVPVGTTRGRVVGALSAAHVVASPERVSSGRIIRDLRTYPKIVGPLDEAGWEAARRFYEAALEAPSLIRVRDPETAELAKLAEGIYRDVNIALANDLARYADQLGIDALEAFAAANSQPYAHLHSPGAGVGGHCIPVYPHFIPRVAGLALPALARETNDSMAQYAVGRLEAAAGPLEGLRVLVLGLAYRANVKEAAHSSAFKLVAALHARGALPLVHDPLYSAAELRAYGVEPPERFPLPVDALIVQAWHDAYEALDLHAFEGCRAVLDGRNALEPARVAAAGMRYIGIGRSG